MENRSKQHVLLSYTPESKTIVEVVRKMLRKENICIWSDEKDTDNNDNNKYVFLFVCYCDI